MQCLSASHETSAAMHSYSKEAGAKSQDPVLAVKRCQSPLKEVISFYVSFFYMSSRVQMTKRRQKV